MEHFLATVCTPEWNLEQDRGRPFAEGIALLEAEHPDRAPLIRAYRERWIEMLAGAIEGSLEILAELRERGVPLYALSNWSAETFPEARASFPFLSQFRGILISGEVGVVKPDPEIYHIMCKRFRLTPAATLFVDDVAANVEAARRLGFAATQFRGAEHLRAALASAGLLPATTGGRSDTQER
jgi:2-haloacid dehalogenase